MKASVLGHLAELPADLAEGPVAERVAQELDRRHAEAHAALVEVLDSPRHAALLDSLVELVASPPWRGRARRPASAVLPPLVERAVARAAREWAAVEALDAEMGEAGEPGEAGDGMPPEARAQERLHLLHETRKRAKAVRYAHEALAPSFGEDASAAARAWEEVTEALGQAQDTVVGEAWLRELLALAQEADEPTFTYGVLLGQQLGARQPATELGERAVRAALEG